MVIAVPWSSSRVRDHPNPKEVENKKLLLGLASCIFPSHDSSIDPAMSPLIGMLTPYLTAADKQKGHRDRTVSCEVLLFCKFFDQPASIWLRFSRWGSSSGRSVAVVTTDQLRGNAVRLDPPTWARYSWTSSCNKPQTD